MSALTLLLTGSVAIAQPPEGLEALSLLKNTSESTLFVTVDHTERSFSSSMQTLQAWVSQPTQEKNIWSYGFSVSVADQYGDRDAYFIKYDYAFSEDYTIGLKIAHEDWRYIASSKDTVGLDIAGYLGEGYGIYFLIGGYYRWLKQRYNEPWWAPLNLNTDDQEGFLVATIGFKGGSKSTYYTIDLNLRDTFRYYHFDHLGTDFVMNTKITEGFYLRFYTGARWSAFFSGTGTITDMYGGLGFVSD